jgi:hypothetical protein
MTMQIHQPMMFVGLGGTGCLVGSELERRLRDELCGPDGQDLIRLRQSSNLLRYQLPSCVQFVYADVNRAELERLPRRSVPAEEHGRAVAFNAHYSSELVPSLNTYPEVAANLRLMAEPYVSSWLPPAEGEPRVAPLSRGAGQLPTVGRAALFETLRTGTRVVRRDLMEAAGRLSKSGEDLQALGGKPPTSVDVFVAFSVAGGTGAGIFLDYLHLLGDVLSRTALKVKIYPLVVMPSAFPTGLGGGRPAQLNAGRALLDLFRLVDQQNGGDVNRVLRIHDPRAASQHIGLDLVSVQYPGSPPIVLDPSLVQTAFLFSLPIGADRSDLHRSIVALIMSLVGTELAQSADTGQHQSFADSFINAGVEREISASNGIGNSGVSTAQVASLTVPVDDLADLVAGRLLRDAVDELSSPHGGASESNESYIDAFFSRSGIHPAVSREQPQFVEPEPVAGAMHIASALRERTNSMKQSLEDLQNRLNHDMPHIVESFNPVSGLHWLLEETDPFRTERILFGHKELPVEWERAGVHGIMQQLRQTPATPEGVTHLPPPPPPMKDRLTRRVRFADPNVVSAVELQNEWHRWRSRDIWSQVWNAQSNRWSRPMEQMRLRLRKLNDALREHTRGDVERFKARSEDLARSRVGVSYLLPLRGGTMEDFYERVISSMITQRVALGSLRPAATPTDLLHHLLQGGRWRMVYEASTDLNPSRAVAGLREFLKEEVVHFLQDPNRPDAILPSMALRLRQAAGLDDGSADDSDVQELRGKLAGLVPAGFAPQGNGQMKILITYPADGVNGQIEGYLRQTLLLPSGPGVHDEFRPVRSESLSVVMFRYGMGVTEVDEVRDVLRTWSQALVGEHPSDYLKWRQRTGYHFGYLATREEHRVAILHHLLCALWNGKVVTSGDPESPREVSVALGGGVTMQLPLQGLDNTSSWADIVRAYELGALEDDRPLRRNFCTKLMMEAPTNLATLDCPPHELYTLVVKMAEQQVAMLDSVMAKLPAETRPRAEQLRQFWAETMPAARRRTFRYNHPVRASLEALEVEYLGRRYP